MKLCIAGKNDIACQVLRLAVERLGTTDILVLPNSDDLGRHSWQQSLWQTAQELGAPVVTLEEVYPIPDLVFLSVEYNLLIKPKLFTSRQLYNIHFSLLPRYKGMFTSIWPILNAEAGSGVTLHCIDKGIDTGAIIDQVSFPIGLDDTSRDLYYKYMSNGYELVARNLAGLISGAITPTTQPAINSTYYSRTSIDYSKLEVNFRQSAFQVHNYVRGFAFYEYQLPTALGHAIRKSELTEQPSLSKPGKLVAEDMHSLVVNTVDYNIRLWKDYSKQLFAAVENNAVERVRELLPLTHDVNITNRQGWSVLMIACYRNSREVAQLLLEAGADVNQTNLSGTSVLMYAKDGAVASQDTSLLSELLNRGATLEHADHSGRTVMDYCRLHQQEPALTFFQNRAAR